MFLKIPEYEYENTFIFSHAGGNTVAWSVPQDCSFVYMLAMGGGGGGGSGSVGASGTARGGGGGGGAAEISQVIYPANFLPDVLYLYVGKGGDGGLNGTNGSAGETSYITYTLEPDPPGVSANYRNIIAANGGNGGGGTTTTAAGSAGAGLSFTSFTRGFLGNALITSKYRGGAGTAGGSGTSPTPNAITALADGMLTGGTGGGGLTTANAGAGTDINGAGIIPRIRSNASTPSGSGFWSFKPLCGTGGAGGGSSSITTYDSIAGNGAYGCGGGGGGAANTGRTSQGGNGGNGLIIIKCW